MAPEEIEQELINDIANFTNDPLSFVRYAFPWGEGELIESSGPRDWQVEILKEIGEGLKAGKLSAQQAIQIATASGHGIGKSALVAWLILWAISTFEDTRGVVTANTDNQLRTKTWAEVAKWHRMLINRHWFEFTATSLFSVDPEHSKTWRIDMNPWSERNTEAFAGLHNKGKRILLIFDEASAIPDLIWEVAEGALTDEDTEIVWCCFGNPTRNVGRFFECFGRFRHRWITKQIDSRDVDGTNKQQIDKWVDDYGEDSDFVRVRVRGIFPRASTLQFIGRDIVDAAMERVPPIVKGETACIGVDVARFGGDQSVIRTRIGRDATGFKPIKMREVDTMTLAGIVAQHVNMLRSMNLRVVIFVDGGGVGGGVVDRLLSLGYEVIEVQFGARASDPKKYANKRAEMWGLMKDWLNIGCIDQDDLLATDLTSVEYGFTSNDQIQLERKEDMRKRGIASPDDADALALTFAFPVQPPVEHIERPLSSTPARNRVEYNPYERM
jgi:hypothetical protein